MAYLPNRYAVAKGVVIDADGNESEQIDVIIYDRQYSYLVLKHNETFLIPAESVYAVFEVKQSLNKGYMEYAQHKTESVRKLKRTSVAIKHAGGKYDPKPLHKIVAGLLTTTSDWAESSTIGLPTNLQRPAFWQSAFILQNFVRSVIIKSTTCEQTKGCIERRRDRCISNTAKRKRHI